MANYYELLRKANQGTQALRSGSSGNSNSGSSLVSDGSSGRDYYSLIKGIKPQAEIAPVESPNLLDTAGNLIKKGATALTTLINGQDQKLKTTQPTRQPITTNQTSNLDPNEIIKASGKSLQQVTVREGKIREEIKSIVTGNLNKPTLLGKILPGYDKQKSNPALVDTLTDKMLTYGAGAINQDLKALPKSDRKRIETLVYENANLQKSKKLFDDITNGKYKEDKGFVDGLKEGFVDSGYSVPFGKEIAGLVDKVQGFDEVKIIWEAAQKQKSGQALSDLEQSYIDKYKAQAFMDEVSDKSFGYVVGASLAQMPKFGLEMYLTAGMSTAPSAGLKATSFFTKLAEKAPMVEKITRGLLASSVQTLGFTPQILSNAQKMTLGDPTVAMVNGEPMLQFLEQKEGSKFSTEVMRMLPKSTVNQYIEVAGERFGEVLDIAGQQLVKNYLIKKGIDVATAKPGAWQKVLKKIGLDSLLSEYAEEVVQNASQDLVNEGKATIPFSTPEDTVQQLATLLTVGIYGSVMRVPGMGSRAKSEAAQDLLDKLNVDVTLDETAPSDGGITPPPAGGAVIDLPQEEEKAPSQEEATNPADAEAAKAYLENRTKKFREMTQTQAWDNAVETYKNTDSLADKMKAADVITNTAKQYLTAEEYRKYFTNRYKGIDTLIDKVALMVKDDTFTIENLLDKRDAKKYIEQRDSKFRKEDPKLKGLEDLVAEAAKYEKADDFGKIKSKGKDSIGRDIPDWSDAIVFHSTDAKSARDINTNGWRILGNDTQMGYYGNAISATPEREYTKQFGDVLTVNKVDPSAKILNLNDEKDWAIFQKLTEGMDARGYRKAITEGGYDGVYDPGAGDLFVYNPTKLKNLGVTSNAEFTNLQEFYKEAKKYLAKRTDKFREAKPEEIKDLIVQHNLSEEKLLHAAKVGGLAVPSLAITNKKAPLDNFGEITLIGDKELISPSTTSKVYASDVYSPRYPKVSFVPSRNATDYLKEKLTAAKKLFGDGEVISEYTWIEYFKDDGKEGISNAYATKQAFYADNNQSKSDERKPVYDYVENNQEKYDKYVNEIVDNIKGSEQIFRGFTNSGNRRYTPHTLENVVKIMKEQLVNGENFNYGVANIRAVLAKRFKSIKEIQKNKNKIISNAEMEEVKGYFEDKFEKIAEKATEGTDRYMSDFATVVTDGIKAGSLKQDLETYGYKDVDLKELESFLAELRESPTEYFEAKIRRAVGLNEFQAAVVPYNVSQETIDLLEKNGLEVVKYGREENRIDVVRKVAEEKGTLFRFKDDFKKATGVTITDVQEAKIIKLNKKIFGDEDIRITGQILTPEGQTALGSYRKGMINILGGQASAVDTFYHEAVHKYLDVLTTQEEQIELLLAARKKFGTEDFGEAEEQLAEDFINYAKSREGATGTIKSIFDKVLLRIKKYFGSEDAIAELYNNIISGKPMMAAKTEVKTKTSKRPVAEVKDEISEVTQGIADKKEMATGKAAVAQDQRNALNTDNIAKLKRIYFGSQKFQEGDLETIRQSNTGKLMDTVIENVQEKFPDYTEQEAFDYAMALPTKSDEKIKVDAEERELRQRKKQLEEDYQSYVAKNGLAVGVRKKAISSGIRIHLADLPEYEKVDVDDQAEQSLKLLVADKMYAMDIALGKAEPPPGLLPESVFIAVENDALSRGDAETIQQLATASSLVSEATTMGQRIRMLAERDPYSPVSAIKSLTKRRQELTEEKSGKKVTQLKKEAETEIKEAVAKAQPKLSEWGLFIDSIKCKV